MTSSPYTANQRHHLENPTSLPGRFSMAIAVEDDSISDDVLVDRLEMARRMGVPSKRGRDVSPSPSTSSDSAHFSSVGGDSNRLLHTSFLSSSPSTPDLLANPRDVPPPFPLIPTDTSSDSEDAQVWQAARKALLCIREIVRTEKKYQEALKMLLNAQVCLLSPT
jgi:hypothetical protein